MVENRGIKIKKNDLKTASVKVPKDHYGSAIVALIYTP